MKGSSSAVSSIVSNPVSIIAFFWGLSWVIDALKSKRYLYQTSKNLFATKLHIARKHATDKAFVTKLFPNVVCDERTKTCFSMDDEGQQLPSDVSTLLMEDE